jgi:hypothetical protein
MISHPVIPTFGGQVTKGETFSKIIHTLDELRDLCLVMAHLHKTEDSAKDDLMALGWRTVEEQFHKTRHLIIQLAQGHIQ